MIPAQKSAPCDNRFTHSGTIYSYVPCVSVRGSLSKIIADASEKKDENL